MVGLMGNENRVKNNVKAGDIPIIVKYTRCKVRNKKFG